MSNISIGTKFYGRLPKLGLPCSATPHTANPTAQQDNGYRRSLAFGCPRSRQCVGT